MGSSTTDFIAGVQKTASQKQELNLSFKDKIAEPSAIVSINSYAKSNVSKETNLNGLQAQLTLKAFNANKENLGHAFDHNAIKNIYQHIIKEFH